MVDPVIASDGQTYERATIEEWLAKSDTSPLTREPLEDKTLRENVLVRTMCRELFPEA